MALHCTHLQQGGTPERGFHIRLNDLTIILQNTIFKAINLTISTEAKWHILQGSHKVAAQEYQSKFPEEHD